MGRESPLPGGSFGLLFTLSLSMLLSSLGTSIANVSLPAIAGDLGTSFQGVQWVVLAYLLAVTTLIVSAGRLADIINSRKLFTAGILLFTAASVLCGLAPSLPVLIAARAVQGLGAAVMMALSLAYAGKAVSEKRTGSAMGLIGAMSAVGTALGPSLGGFLISLFGWRSVFLVKVPLGVISILLARRYLPSEDRTHSGQKPSFDWAGTALLAATLAAYSLAMTVGKGTFATLNAILLAAAFAGTGLLTYSARTSSSPIVDPSLLRDPALVAGLATSALVSTVLMATLVVGPFYLTHSLKLGMAAVGLTMSIGPIAVALTGIPLGRAVDRIGARPMTLAGLSVVALGSVLLSVLPSSFGTAGYLVPMVILTVGYAAFQTANNTGVMRSGIQKSKGVVSGMLNLSRNLGLITGTSLMGAVFASASGTDFTGNPDPSAVSLGMRITFAFSTILIVTAIAISTAASFRSGAVAAEASCGT